MNRKIEPTVLKTNNYRLNWGQRTYIMGILNLTPDSFSDGGEFNQVGSALKQVHYMVQNGADIIDIGGQSTRPGAVQISLEEELNRVIPIIKAIRQQTNISLSIDTTRAKVAEAALEAGADIINDISGGTYDQNMLTTAANFDVPIILMHIKGTPQTMQNLTEYQNLISEIINFLKHQIDRAIALNIKHHNIIVDPGIGFAKNTAQNIQLIQQLNRFKSLNVPLLIGVSRKSFIGKIINKDKPKDRVWGTAAACCGAIANGADIIRVHDVAQMHDVARVADAIWRNQSPI